MIDFEKKDILIKSGVKKRIKVAYGDSSFSNESIYSEQFVINPQKLHIIAMSWGYSLCIFSRWDNISFWECF